jgi:hypothetical protein
MFAKRLAVRIERFCTRPFTKRAVLNCDDRKIVLILKSFLIGLMLDLCSIFMTTSWKNCQPCAEEQQRLL